MNRAFGSGLWFGPQPVVLNLLIINALLFLLTNVAPGLDLDKTLNLYQFQSPNFRPWQLLTHMFMHADVGHIFGNMLGLFLFGNALEHLWGRQRFLFFYLFTGLGAALMQMGWSAWELHQQVQVMSAYGITLPDIQMIAVNGLDDSIRDSAWQALHMKSGAASEMAAAALNTTMSNVYNMLMGGMLGASGAVYGVMMGFALMFGEEVISAPGIYIPMKAKFAVGIYALMELKYGIVPLPGDSVAHYAHLGGMVFGFVLVKYWKRRVIL